MKRHEQPSSRVVHGMVSASPKMHQLFHRVERVARTDSTVLIRGESGTGKELVARAIHAASRRSSGPFRAINCATLTPEHLASELFGHVRGAFTGAVRDRAGLFALAHRGTLFLDEVAEIPLDLQARLLRVLQERVYVPLGGTAPRDVDVRILAATHRALRSEVAAGRFREDLMYRIRVVPLYLPTLAERTHDITALTWTFIDEFNALSAGWGGREIHEVRADTLALMHAYRWPGNVRELRNVVEQAFALGEGPVLLPDDLTPELRGEPPVAGGPTEAALLGLPETPTAELTEEARIRGALAASGGRRAAAAEALGISRTTLWRRMQELGI